MLIYSYYRCPVSLEKVDEEHPRLFVLGQVIEYSEIADAVKVKLHDLLGSIPYYHHFLGKNTFYTKNISRCAGVVGGLAEGDFGRGIIAAVIPPETEDEPYWYYVKKNNGDYVKVCETELYLDYTQMDYSPEKQIKNYEFQNPCWFINRIKVSKNLHLVNNASYGFKTLTGCRAYLLPHQVSTITRCLESYPVRYMLADEVGLGKTVEACSIMKIMRRENTSLRVLIVVPSSLIGQWKNELIYKFELEASDCSEDNICITDYEGLSTESAYTRKDWDLLIVDETHRLLKDRPLYDRIQGLSERIPNLLLLSATPIQDRKEEYRLLLALLSPELYHNMTLERFTWLIQKQKGIQQVVNQQLGRLAKYDDYRDSILSKLQDISKSLEDRVFTKLLSSIDVNSEDKGLASTTQALSYVCENYRLERKVVRNRRQIISQKMSKRTLVDISYDPLTADDNYNEAGVIQELLSYLMSKNDGSQDFITYRAIPLLNALFSSPWALLGEIERQNLESDSLINAVKTWKKQAEIEHSLIREALEEDPDLIKGRLLRVLDYLDQDNRIASTPDHKVVVFSTFPETLYQFIDLFNVYFEQYGVYAVPFSSKMSEEELEDSVYEFQNNQNCRVIVCDETGGEGRNFQNAKQVVHLDLPWNANALEQRIGRLDRLGRKLEDDVQSLVIYASCSIEEQLFKIWSESLSLFTQSLSGLEIITGELNSLIINALLDDIYLGLSKAFEDILQEVEEMRESVEDEQLFDIGATLYKPLSQGIENVLNLYEEKSDEFFSDAMLGWSEQVGMHPERNKDKKLIEFNEYKFSPNAAKQALFTPPTWDLYTNTSMMRRMGRIIGSFDRGVAALSEDVLFFAPGDAVYDAIISNASACGRGRSTAMGLYSDFNYDGLVYFFNVDVPITELLEKNIGLQNLAKYRMYLPLNQIIVTIPLTRASKEVSEEQVIQEVLKARLNSIIHLGKRGSYMDDESPLKKFIMNYPPDKWEPIVENCTKQARSRAEKLLWEGSDWTSCRNEMLRLINGRKAEDMYFEKGEGNIEALRLLFKETFRALEAAKPTLDAVCLLRVRRHG